MPDDELVEEVDTDGHVLRVVTRAEMRADHLRHRCVYLPILGHDGRLLVHRRSPDKDVWPGRWDVAAGGVAGAGEAWSLAAARELAEEVGLLDVVLEPIGSGAYEDDEVRVLGRVYLVRSDGPFAFTDGEVVEARFVDAAGLASLREEAPFCPDSLAIVLPLLGWSPAPPGLP